MFLGESEDSETVSNYLVRYEEKKNQIMEDVIIDYFMKNEGIAKEEAQKKYQVMLQSETEDIATMITADLLVEVERKIRAFHESIYKYYRKTLSQEQKDEINIYINKVQTQIQSEFLEMKKVMVEEFEKMREEYKRDGEIKTYDELYSVQVENEADSLSIEEVKDSEENNNEEIELSEENEQEVDPVLGMTTDKFINITKNKGDFVKIEENDSEEKAQPQITQPQIPQQPQQPAETQSSVVGQEVTSESVV